jgi:predicted secreted hydrolase
MLPFEQAKQNLGRLAQAIQLSVTLLGVDDAMANASKLGKRETFVYLSKEDITDPTRRRVTEKLISQHFR